MPTGAVLAFWLGGWGQPPLPDLHGAANASGLTASAGGTATNAAATVTAAYAAAHADLAGGTPAGDAFTAQATTSPLRAAVATSSLTGAT